MKRQMPFIVAALFCAFAGWTNAAPARPSNAWFEHTVQTMLDAVTTGDRSVWGTVLAPNCIVTDEDGNVYGKRAFLAQVHRLPRGFSGTLLVKDLRVLPIGSDAAIVHYYVDEHEAVFAQHLHTYYIDTDTFVRIDGSWKIEAMETVVVPRDLVPLTQSRASWPRLVGVYAYDPAAQTHYRVFIRDGELYGGQSIASATRLIPLTSHVFFQEGSIHTMIFIAAPSGAVNEVIMVHKYNEVIMRRI